MDNKEIQKQRMMRYFIDATKEIIKEEGIKGVTARKVGERAGYSYATIYNYFQDLNGLLLYCAFDLLEDCHQYLMKFRDRAVNSREQIVLHALSYVNYFFDNPEMFQLIFLEELGELPKELIENNPMPSVAKFLRESIAACAKEGYISEEKVEFLAALIASSVHGKLMITLKRRSNGDIEEIKDAIIREIEFLIPNKKKSDV